MFCHSCPPRCQCFLSLPRNSETNCPLLLKPKYCTLSTRQVLATCLRHFHFLLTSVKRSCSATTTKHPCNQTTRSNIKEAFSLFSFHNQMFSCAPGIWEQTALMFLEHSYVKRTAAFHAPLLLSVKLCSSTAMAEAAVASWALTNFPWIIMSVCNTVLIIMQTEPVHGCCPRTHRQSRSLLSWEPNRIRWCQRRTDLTGNGSLDLKHRH